MESQTITINGATIAYRESAGQGPAALLIHGNSASSRAYLPQLAGALGQRYRLVAIDLPGHGDSAPAADPAATYTLPGYAAVVRAFAERLGLLDAVLVGWSLGGHVALEAAPGFPDAAGLLIFGTPPLAVPPAMEAAFLPNPAMAAAFSAELDDAAADAFAAAFLRPGAEPEASFVEDIRRTDGQARATLGLSVAMGTAADELAIARDLTVPLAIVHGEDEQLVSEEYIRGLTLPTLWRGAIQRIPQAGHAPQWEQPAAFDAILGAFLEDCAARERAAR